MEKWKLVPDAIGGPYMLANGSGAWVKADEALAKIAELEETLKSWMETTDNFCSRAVAAEAKLAMVKEWADMPLEYENKHGETLDDILSDTQPPLAVDNSGIWCPDCDEVIYSTWNGCHEIGQDYLGTAMLCSKAIQPVTVIVMARKEEK